MENRREGRLSLGSGIRDLERRTSEVLPNYVAFRNNIQTVIEEIRPYMERARSVDSSNVTLSSWLNNSHPTTPAAGPSREPNSSVNSEQVVIDIDNNVTEQSGPDAPVNTSNNNNNNSTNTDTEARSNLPSPTGSVNTPSIVGGSTHNADGSEANDDHMRLTSTEADIIKGTIRIVPFFLIVITKFIFDHIPSIFLFIGLLLGFNYYNYIIKKEVSRQTARNFHVISIFICNIMFLVAALTYILVDGLGLQLNLSMLPQKAYTVSMGELVWNVVVSDFILKLMTIVVKSLFVLIPYRVVPPTRRGKYFLFIEASSQVYRGCVPLQPWLHYLLDAYEGPKRVIGVFLSAAYIVSKGNILMVTFQMWWASVVKIFKNVTVGKTPTKEQIAEAGNICSICHDEYKVPVVLECQHIFCEVCICKWLDREHTCPLCRTSVSDDPSWRDGSTSYFINMY